MHILEVFGIRVKGTVPVQGKAYNCAMYQEFFGLSEIPFSIAPDPRYLYMSERHREALAHLLYGLNSDGAFILLTGDVGTGKTTVSRCLLEQIPEDTKLALVLNPKVSALELLETICDELYGTHNAPCMNVPNNQTSIKLFIDIINRYLLDAHAQGRKTVILIEEAQNLDLDVLEQLRLLTNLETNEHKLLQVILLGQPELLDILDRPELSQLAQRITARYHLTPLSQPEMMAYVEHRLAVAGCQHTIFSTRVMHRLYQLTGGIPRLVNVLCDRALLGAYVQNRNSVDCRTLDTAAREVFGAHSTVSPAKAGWRPGRWAAALLAGLVIGTAGLLYQWPGSALQEEAAQLIAAVPEVEPETVAPEAESSHPDPAVVTSELQWPDEAARLRSNSLAFQSLFRQWKLNYQPQLDGSPCFFAQTRGMACFEDRSNLEKLRTLNRPVVLKLHDHLNRDYYATLTGLGRHVARLEMAGNEQTVDIETIYQHWSGEFTLLWQQPAVYRKPIVPGDKGDDVVWLSQQLQQIDRSGRLQPTPVYEQTLIETIKKFQLEQGLVADGIVGVHTLVRLNNKLGVDAPNLLNEKS